MAKIFLLDNSVLDRIKMRNALEPAGYVVEEISDGREAIEMALRNPPDCVVLDLIIVGMDGFKVIRELRKNGFKSPIIVQTNMTEESMKKMSLEVGADAFLRKPVSPQKLSATVKQLLGEETSEDD